MLIVWYFDFLLNLNSCSSQEILMLHEMSISFDMFLVDSEKFVLLFVNAIEWD
jgi:hypothetical protein